MGGGLWKFVQLGNNLRIIAILSNLHVLIKVRNQILTPSCTSDPKRCVFWKCLISCLKCEKIVTTPVQLRTNRRARQSHIMDCAFQEYIWQRNNDYGGKKKGLFICYTFGHLACWRQVIFILFWPKAISLVINTEERPYCNHKPGFMW